LNINAFAGSSVAIQTNTTFAGIIDGNAGMNISGAESIMSSATVSDLTSNRIVVAGSSGALEDNANLTFNGSTLSVTADTTITGVTTITGDTEIIGNLDLTNSSASSGRISANFLDVPNVSPIGSIIVWPGAVNTWPTTNWRLCNGAGGFSQADYPELWQVLGGSYGGNSSNFNLPNLQNRFVGGVGDSPLNALGTAGGNKNAVLLTHNHGITEPNNGQGHRHEYNDRYAQKGTANYGDESNNVYEKDNERNPETAFNTTGISINNRGINANGNNSNNITGTDRNLPPYMALYWIIRIK